MLDNSELFLQSLEIQISKVLLYIKCGHSEFVKWNESNSATPYIFSPLFLLSSALVVPSIDSVDDSLTATTL